MHAVKISQRRKRFFLLVYFVCIGIFFEGATRLILSVDSVFEKIKGEDDASRRLMWIRKHHGQIKNRYVFDIYHPTRGWALRPGISNMSVFDGKMLNSNSQGIRGRDEYSYEKPPGTLRVLVLGDSFTFGEEVSDHETFPFYLQKMMPDSEVLNFGIHGYGHDQMLIYLQEEGSKYHPDIVVLGFVYGDMKRNLLKFRDYAKPKFVLVPDGLKLTNVPVPSPESVLEKEVYRSKFHDALTILYHKVMLSFSVEQRRAEEITTAILDELSATIHAIGAVPVFVYLPYNTEMENREDEMTEREKYLFQYCDNKGIYCTSVRPYFAAAIRKGDALKTTGHWDAKGNLIAAEGIRDFLQKNVLAGAE
jgi:hypothetical protein